MNENMYEAMFKLQETHWWFRAKRDIVLSFLSSDTRQHIIDFGCGTGMLLESLCKFGEVTGVDISPKALGFCKSRSNVRLVQADLSKKLPIDSKYDVGMALDVLEHLEDDLAALKNMKSMLKHKGRLIVTVPAFMFLWSAHDENSAHKRRYHKKELEALIKEAGLEIEYLSYYNFWLFPAIAAIRFLFNLFNINKNSEAENRQNGKLVNTLLYNIFKSEEVFIRNRVKLPFGVSLIAVLSVDLHV